MNIEALQVLEGTFFWLLHELHFHFGAKRPGDCGCSHPKLGVPWVSRTPYEGWEGIHGHCPKRLTPKGSNGKL